jgi:heavy metal sensor kinase
VRLPIRVRLTVWYAVLLATIIVGLGTFVVLELHTDLQDTVDRELRASSVQIARGYQYEGSEDFVDVSNTVLSGRTSVAQVLDPSGRVLLSYGEPIGGPIVPREARADALADRTRLMTITLDGQDHRALVSRVQRLGHARVLVVAESLKNVNDSVNRVLVLLLLAGPAALLAVAAGGWWLARKALRPVEQMTSQAAAIGIDRLHERISPPRSQDEIAYLALTLNAMLDRLEQGVEEKHRLIADASHELRTPLAAMRAELEVSLLDDDLTPAAQEVLESALEEVDRMSHTVDNLLTLARVDEGRLELLTTRVDLRAACEAAADPLRPLAATKGLRFEVEGESCEVEADPYRLQQALRNFIENAVKYTPPEGEVRITSWCRGEEAGVTVADTGPGIPPEARARIFDRFYRVDPARGRKGGGSGLGLAICREIALAHGGRVSVDSEEGSGSAFTLALPRPPGTVPAETGAPAVAPLR